MKLDRRLWTNDRRGWAVWTWSKVGALLVFAATMLMFLTSYGYASASEQANGANQLSRQLRNAITDAYDSLGGATMEFTLPKSIAGEDYSIEIIDKGDGLFGVITRTKSGIWEVSGGASLTAPLSPASFGFLKQTGDSLESMCVVKDETMIRIQRSKC
jgi:hypothetical protein